MGNTAQVTITDDDGKRKPPVRSSSTMTNTEIRNLFEDREYTDRVPRIEKQYPPSLVDEAISYFRDEFPVALDDGIRYMTSGTETAQKQARRVFSSTVGDVAYALIQRSNGDQGWEIYLPSDLSLRRTFAYNWAAANAIEKYGTRNDEDYLDETSSAADSVSASYLMVHGRELANRINDEAHWRGVAALVLSGLVDELFRSEPLPDGGPEFIEWAGHQDDLTEALDIIREREVLQPEVIQGLIAQRHGVEKALRNGTL